MDTAAIKHHLYDPVAEQVAAALGTEVDLRIEKDKISQGLIHRSMFDEALQAPVYIADLTGANANVYLELGVRWALRDHVTVLVCQNINQDVKFNVAVNRVIHYGQNPTELESARKKIVAAILEGLESKRVDSPVRHGLDVNKLHPEIARLRQERTVRHAPGDRLLRSLGGHIRTLVDRQKPRRRRVIVTSVIACLTMVTFFVFVRAFFPLAQPHEIGGAYPSPDEEFLAQFENQATGRCLVRNSVLSHSDNSEIPGPIPQGSDIYQGGGACNTGPDPGLNEMLVLVPINGGWLLRSSVKINLCLQANGNPSDDQHLAVCSRGDDRQQWQIQVVQHTKSEVVVIKNRNTGMCLAHNGTGPGDPGKPIAILQRPCILDAGMEWAMRKPFPIGDKDCRNQGSVKIRNHEKARLFVGDGDRPRMSGEGSMLSLATAGRSAHGCTMKIIGPSANCMGVSEDSSAAEVLWMSCNDQPNQRWIIQSMGKENGQEWLQLRPSYDTSRCLQQSEDAKDAPLVAPPCRRIWSQQWGVD
ncbi:MAG: RICIN domain-containing protein [Pseudonocardiaceae bacterium]